MNSRRHFLGSVAGLLAAPSIIEAPVKVGPPNPAATRVNEVNFGLRTREEILRENGIEWKAYLRQRQIEFGAMRSWEQ
jgi:hypothetical protein